MYAGSSGSCVGDRAVDLDLMKVVDMAVLCGLQMLALIVWVSSRLLPMRRRE